MTRIDTAIVDGSLFTDPTLTRACELAAQKGRALHLIGLVLRRRRPLPSAPPLRSPCVWRSSRSCRRSTSTPSWDGRDTMPNSGLGHLEELQQQFREIGVGQLASVSGRYFAMDRDLRWGERAASLRRDGHRPPRRRNLRRPHRAHPRALQLRYHRRVRPAPSPASTPKARPSASFATKM